jgi:hypothetical protein
MQGAEGLMLRQSARGKRGELPSKSTIGLRKRLTLIGKIRCREDCQRCGKLRKKIRAGPQINCRFSSKFCTWDVARHKLLK